MTSSKIIKSFENIKNSIYKTYSRDPALMMVHTGTIGWLLSSAAQLENVIDSDKFTPDEKKFLIPQEALDAIVNIGLFYGVTNSCKNLSKTLVSSGKLLSKGIREYIAKNPFKDKFKNYKLGDFNTNLSTIYEDDGEFFKIYQPFKTGVDMAVNTVACIIASNIITPIVRNKLAAMRQKQAIVQDKIKDNSMSPTSPVLPAQNRLGIEDYKKQVSLNAPNVNVGGSMRI